jgi:hypothetical protein
MWLYPTRLSFWDNWLFDKYKSFLMYKRRNETVYVAYVAYNLGLQNIYNFSHVKLKILLSLIIYNSFSI